MRGVQNGLKLRCLHMLEYQLSTHTAQVVQTDLKVLNNHLCFLKASFFVVFFFFFFFFSNSIKEIKGKSTCIE